MNNPFRYSPSKRMQTAAGKLIASLKSDKRRDDVFCKGKMLGILLCRRPDSSVEELYAYSGKRCFEDDKIQFEDGSIAEFVPPVYDVTIGYFHEKEKHLSFLNREIARLQTELEADGETWSEACGEAGRKDDSNGGCEALPERIELLKKQRAEESAELQKWVFEQYIVSNAAAEQKSVASIFAEKALIPPASTGDCAAPKLLQYAFLHNLEPIELGEFWYGESPDGPVREEERFYPACSWKCGPLLGFMLKGLDIEEDRRNEDEMSKLQLVYMDEELAVVNKASSMPSVPGLDGRESVMEILHKEFPDKELYEVHRLDQDTSGLLVFAFDKKTQACLRKQFENREVRKKYIALLDCSKFGVNKWLETHPGEGTIELPLAPDYEDKPRQKISFAQGKTAVTRYKILPKDSSTDKKFAIFGNLKDDILQGRLLPVEFCPETGRTHQLRVHSAHHKGLACPIAGDTLYGSGCAAKRLCLHASYLRFRHPSDGRIMEFTTD